MACQTCGRLGDCRVCCCIHPSHRVPLPSLTDCPLCKHALARPEGGR